MSNDYFTDLNYSLGNEDTRLESVICKSINAENIWSIAGCGGRALPLVTEQTKNLHIVDISIQQIHLSKMRLESVRKLDYEGYLKFWGFPPYTPNDHKIFRKKSYDEFELEEDARIYFNELFKRINWDSPILHGKWEKTFIIFSKVIRKIMRKKDYEIFNFNDIEKQRDFFENEFSKRRWNFILKLLGNKSVFDKLLYKGNFIKKNVEETHFEYYQKAFENIFTKQLCKNNFFLNLCFFGKLKSPDCNTIEAEENTFNLLKRRSLEIDFYFHTCDFQTSLSKIEKDSLDYISISDVPSYFEGNLERDFIQIFRPYLKKGGLLCLRSYLRVPEASRVGFTDIERDYEYDVAKEQVQMYRVEVLRKD